MSLLTRLFGQPRKPELTFAADGFYPIAVMQINNVGGDLNAIADAYAESLFSNGCTAAQALSAKWGGASAVGQDLTLFQSHVTAFDETLAQIGGSISDPKVHARTKYRAAATLFLSQIMADAPGEYERFLRYMGR